VLNSGHRKGGAVLRTVGDDYEPRSFATYSACAIALIGSLPDTLHDRAVSIELKRRMPTEKAEPFRPDRANHLDVLARKAVRWANDHADRIGAADPAMPQGIINRAADNWRPLLAIADVAGGEWPERARKAAEASRNAEGDDGSRLELLLGDIRDTFADRAEMPSADLVKALVELEGHPWAELGKSRKPLTQNRLARMLKPLGIAPQKIGPEKERVNGYVRAHFKEAFGRYLGSEGDSQPDIRTECDEIRTSDIFKPDSREQGCPVVKCKKPNNDGVLSGCPVAKGDSGPRAQVRTPKPKSDDLPYTGRVIEVPDLRSDPLDVHGVPRAAHPQPNGGEPGLSQWRIRVLADQYQELAYANAQAHDGDTRTAECNAWLRQTLAEDGVLHEFIEIEFKRVMAEVFRV